MAARSSELLVNTSLAVADVPLSVVEQRDIVMHVIECDTLVARLGVATYPSIDAARQALHETRCAKLQSRGGVS